MKIIAAAVLCLGFSFSMSGCAGPEEVLATSYNQACQFDSDCVVVASGNYCGACSPCPNAAIHKDDKASFDSAVAQIDCDNSGDALCGACQQPVATCMNSVCDARSPVYVDPLSFARNCSTDADCVVIQVGEVCSTCHCDYGAINQTGATAAQELASNATCGTPEPCNISCTQPTAVCSSGQCAIAP